MRKVSKQIPVPAVKKERSVLERKILEKERHSQIKKVWEAAEALEKYYQSISNTVPVMDANDMIKQIAELIAGGSRSYNDFMSHFVFPDSFDDQVIDERISILVGS